MIARAEGARGVPDGRAAVEAFLLPLLATDAVLPCQRFRGGWGLALTYIAGVTGASPRQVSAFNTAHGLTEAVALRPGPCPLQTPITGKIERRPWRTLPLLKTSSVQVKPHARTR